MSCSLSQCGVWTVWCPKALCRPLLSHLLAGTVGRSTLPHQLCCRRLLLTGQTGASPGVRMLKANIILHLKWQSRMPSHPCQSHSRVTSPTLIFLSLHAGEPDWVMDDDWRMLLSLVKHWSCVLLFSSLVRGSLLLPKEGQTWWICLLD